MPKSPIDALDQACLDYLNHLEKEMLRLLKKDNPNNSQLKISDDLIKSGFEVGKITVQSNVTSVNKTTGMKEDTEVNKTYFLTPPYVTYSDEFTAVHKKWKIVQSAHSALATGNDENKISKFMSIINTNKTVLEKNRDSATKRFFSAIGHVLSLGIVSKASKGSFCFWKSHGKVFVENVSDIANKAQKQQKL